MAVATTVIRRDATSLKRVIATLTFSGTYTTGGEVSTNGFLKDLSLSSIHMVHFDQGGGGADGVILRYDYAANKVFMYEADQIDDFLAQLASGASLTNVAAVRAEFIGEGN